MAKQLELFDKVYSFKQNNSKYLDVEGDIPLDLPKGSFISITRYLPLKIYSLGFQPAKSIPEIPRWFLTKYASLPFTVLEPFSGAGTTIIESLRFGASVYWIDYHPLSRLICRVKTTKFSPLEIMEAARCIVRNSINQKNAPETINFSNKDFWFQKSVQEGLEILREQIEYAKEATQPVLWLAFASTVRKTSNMNDGMILAARRSHIEKIPERSRNDVFKDFQRQVDTALKAITEWNKFVNVSFNNAKELPIQDARKLEGDWECDAVITSPPYINAIDYVWASKFELHWLGMMQSDEDRLNLYSKEIGTERIPKDECKELGQTGNFYLDNLIEEIYTGKKYKASRGQNELRARVVYKYFIDMKEHFKSCFSKIRPGGYYCFSIGDFSKICGVDIPVASMLTELACETGFREIFYFHILLKNRKLNVPRNVDWAGIIKHDSLVVLQRPHK